MNKTYEAPVAEMIEMSMPAVLMASQPVGGGDPINPGTSGDDPFGD